MYFTDLEAMQKWMDITPLHGHLNIRIGSVDEETGKTTLKMPFNPTQTRRIGYEEVHGGAIATLIDIAGAAAMVAKHGYTGPTINLRTDYISLADGNGLTATAEIETESKSSAVVDVRICADDGRVVALGRCVYSLKKVAETGLS